MRITEIGSDLVEIDEENLNDKKLLEIPRIHLIKLSFKLLTEYKIKKVLELFDRTNRFIIDDNIRIYNDFLKKTNKKFYVSNKIGTKLISFLRKNNKILLNLNFLSLHERDFICGEGIFCDLLENLEVIRMTKEDFESHRKLLEKWNGNVIISNV